MSIYQSFAPTFLYIKQHNITKKLYFGKTIRDPLRYKGSGKHWVNHYKKHGENEITTIWYCLYTEKELLLDAAISFSELWNIVESDDWLNIIPENGLDGYPLGLKLSENTKKKISISKKGKLNPKISGKLHYHYGKPLSDIRKEQNRQSSSGKNNPMYGKPSACLFHTEETKNKIKKSNTGKKRTKSQREIMALANKKLYENGRIANCAKSVIVDGVTYDSMVKASVATGYTLYKIRKLLK
jgi:hypothetical protein